MTRCTKIRSAFALWLLGALAAGTSYADSGAPVGRETYRSPSGTVALEIDPGRVDASKLHPVLTLRRDSDVVWRRTPEDFEDFDYPLHALVADEGGYLVFGGVSVHNFGNYDEGLRLYDGDGHLVRFVSRKDLPPGHYSISTAHWYDAERSHIEGTTLVFYTPGRDAPIRFDLKRGTALPEGAVVPG